MLPSLIWVSKICIYFFFVFSKLMCLHYSSWDKSKEWTTDLPKGEEITGLAIGSGWLAAATSVNRLRLFSLGGVQKGLVEVGGQIVATSGNEDLLFVAFHSGFGKVTKLKLYRIATIFFKVNAFMCMYN
jgi:hypothetical protein